MIEEDNNKPPNDHPAVSIEKALLADICLGFPLGRIALDLPETAPPPGDVNAPDTYLFRGSQLAALKHAARSNHPGASEAVAALAAAGDKALELAPPSVTDKPHSRFSPDPHDYQSLAKYHWPDPARQNGFPWIRRDGEVNPDCYSEDFDYLRLSRLADNLTVLSVAAYLTDEARYATHAVAMLQRWFIASETRQNPHFKLSQVIPPGPDGPYEGRWAGLIEARFLIYVTEAARLLASTGHLSPQSGAALRGWFGQLLDWMLESPAGKRALAATNNIGLWQALQCMVYADFCGRTELAETLMRDNVVPQIQRQIAPDGSLPKELSRAYPHDYIAFSVAAMALISRAGEHHGLALWDQKRGDGRNFQAPHDWLLQATRSADLLAQIDRNQLAADSTSAPQDAQLAHALDAALQQRAMDRAIRALEILEKQHATHVSRLGTELDTLRKEHFALSEENTALRSERERMASDYARLQTEHSDLLRYTLRVENLVDQLLASRSWRLTSPIRLLTRTLRGGHRASKRSDFLPFRPAALSSSTLDFSASTSLSLHERARRAFSKVARHTPEEYLARLRDIRPEQEDALRAAYATNPLSTKADTFVLYRIIGNDLHPRHRIGQSRENLRFVLEHEPPLPHCEKRWIVNRIINPDEERKIIELLTSHGQEYIHIPFVADEYREIDWDFNALPAPDFLDSEAFRKLSPEEQDRAQMAVYRLKNLYVMNNNGARNTALRDGRKRAKWVLPWDGNCFVTAQAWRDIVADVTARPHLKYFAVPMERMLDNADLLRDDYRPNPVEEPQLLFRCDAAEEFNEAFPYGRRPKVELFWRLGIPGIWEAWRDDPWDPPRRATSPDAGHTGCAGWVARMFSGQSTQEHSDHTGRKNRQLARTNAILTFINKLDQVLGLPAACAPNSPAPPSSLSQATVIYADRQDGLGERLNAIVNAATIAQITNIPFRFTWADVSSNVQESHAIANVREVFSEEFISSHYAPKSKTENVPSLNIPRKSWTGTQEFFTQALRKGPIKVPQSPPLINVLKESKPFRQKLSNRVWDSIRFAEPIERIRHSVLTDPTFPDKSVAIHLRAGDILYGHHSYNPRWTNKVICAPMAGILARTLRERGHAIIFFGQESDTARKLASLYGCQTADEFYPVPPQNNVEAAFADIFLMSRCSTIYAGNSGFAKIASQIKLATLQDPLTVFSRREWLQHIRAEAATNSHLYSGEQWAFAYLVCIDFSLKCGTIDALPEYIQLARRHNPKNGMYTLLEGLIPLYHKNLERSNSLLESYFRDCDLDSPRSFSRSEHIRILQSKDNGTPSGLAFSRFAAIKGNSVDRTRHPYVAAALDFLDRPYDTESLELLRLDLRAAATLPA